MVNQNYRKGRRKEYSICDKLKKEGFDIVQRTSGSHSPFDIIAIDTKNKRIRLIQSKRVLSQSMNTINEQQKIKIENELQYLNGCYDCMLVAM